MIYEKKEWLEIFQIKSAFLEDIEDAIRHGMLVSNIAYLLAKIMNMDDLFLEDMHLAGMVHDVGKLKIGNFLYGRQKDGLKVEELKHMQRHPVLGFEILKEYSYCTESVLQAVYHHHENYDGSGYPDNLRGTAIPLGSRILRISDVYATLVSERPYREAYTKDLAIEMMIEEVKNFDMQIFLAFLNLLHSNEFDELEVLLFDKK